MESFDRLCVMLPKTWNKVLTLVNIPCSLNKTYNFCKYKITNILTGINMLLGKPEIMCDFRYVLCLQLRQIPSSRCRLHHENAHTRWRHQMETFSTLLAICAGNSLVTGEFPIQRPVTRSFDIFFDLRLNKWLVVNNPEAGDLRRHHVNYDVSVIEYMVCCFL